MYGLMLDQLKGFAVTVDSDMHAIYESVEFFKTEEMERHSLLMLAYVVLVSVRVLLVNNMGQLSCSSAAPRPNLLTTV